MVSVPGVLNDNNVQNIFNSSFDQGPSNEGWMIYDWVGADNEQVKILMDGFYQIPYCLEKRIGCYVMIDNPIFLVGKGRTVDLNGFEIKHPGWTHWFYLIPVLLI